LRWSASVAFLLPGWLPVLLFPCSPRSPARTLPCVLSPSGPISGDIHSLPPNEVPFLLPSYEPYLSAHVLELMRLTGVLGPCPMPDSYNTHGNCGYDLELGSKRSGKIIYSQTAVTCIIYVVYGAYRWGRGLEGMGLEWVRGPGSI